MGVRAAAQRTYLPAEPPFLKRGGATAPAQQQAPGTRDCAGQVTARGTWIGLSGASEAECVVVSFLLPSRPSGRLAFPFIFIES